jgi:hypothetical protein
MDKMETQEDLSASSVRAGLSAQAAENRKSVVTVMTFQESQSGPTLPAVQQKASIASTPPTPSTPSTPSRNFVPAPATSGFMKSSGSTAPSNKYLMPPPHQFGSNRKASSTGIHSPAPSEVPKGATSGTNKSLPNPSVVSSDPGKSGEGRTPIITHPPRESFHKI